MRHSTKNQSIPVKARSPTSAFTLMELLLTISLAALIIGIAVPAFIGINRGAVARQAQDLVTASLKQAQVESVTSRRRVAFYIVENVLVSNHPWASSDMENRSYFIYAEETKGVAKEAGFVTSIQTLPAPMMFDLTGSTLPTETIKDPSTGSNVLQVRGFRFVPAGGVLWDDAQSVSNGRFDVVITEGLASATGYTPKSSGDILKNTNSVNVFTGRVYRP